MKFRNQFNYKLGDQIGDLEIGDSESMTVPDQSYTVKEILEKFTHGIGVDCMRDAQYSDSQDFDEFNPDHIHNIDLTDIQEVENHLKMLRDAEKRRVDKSVSKRETKGTSDKTAGRPVDEGSDDEGGKTEGKKTGGGTNDVSMVEK